MKTIKTIIVICATSSIIFSGIALSAEIDQTTSQKSSARRQGPPPEAYTACESKNIGDKAQFVNPHGKTLTGTCEQEGDLLVLRPDNQPGKGRNDGRHQGPPPEAYSACETKNIGDEAQFVNPQGETMIGTCEQQGNQLVLRPYRTGENTADKTKNKIND